MPRNKKARTRRASWVFRRLYGTGLDSYLVGRGNLNWLSKLLIYNINIGFCFWLEYQLEYCIPLDYLFSFDLTSTLRNHDWQ